MARNLLSRIAGVLGSINNYGAREELGIKERERKRARKKTQQGQNKTLSERMTESQFYNTLENSKDRGAGVLATQQSNNQNTQGKKNQTGSYHDGAVEYGGSGKKVYEAQRKLKELRYLDKEPDGNFDYETFHALRTYLEKMQADKRYDLDFKKIDDTTLQAIDDPFKHG